MAVQLKSASAAVSRNDGRRVLVERRRPRGLELDELALTAWCKELAPSDELRRWYRSRPRQWLLFRRRYLEELCRPETMDALDLLHQLANDRKPLTLLASARDLERGHAAILRDLLTGARKPPSTTGPIHAAAEGRAKAARRRR